MPLYDYCCDRCGLQFECRHSVAAQPPLCPHCAGVAHRIFVSAPAVHGRMAQGREQAARSLEPSRHGPGCPCCH
ncbi:FmdB family zinc ribbon protein [Thiohalobacter thiocyanaticus]|uniref:Zinc ribbon domain-containing protein n=1 Tax=Thiohalobacter thiocyanaticus TaxID=585455 RepID=A0A426QHT7_9GAMM|nr:zinc ribbon domain-containing protein [Thiohalobacter thiocyanaticus]